MKNRARCLTRPCGWEGDPAEILRAEGRVACPACGGGEIEESIFALEDPEGKNVEPLAPVARSLSVACPLCHTLPGRWCTSGSSVPGEPQGWVHSQRLQLHQRNERARQTVEAYMNPDGGLVPPQPEGQASSELEAAIARNKAAAIAAGAVRELPPEVLEMAKRAQKLRVEVGGFVTLTPELRDADGVKKKLWPRIAEYANLRCAVALESVIAEVAHEIGVTPEWLRELPAKAAALFTKEEVSSRPITPIELSPNSYTLPLLDKEIRAEAAGGTLTAVGAGARINLPAALDRDRLQVPDLGPFATMWPMHGGTAQLADDGQRIARLEAAVFWLKARGDEWAATCRDLDEQLHYVRARIKEEAARRELAERIRRP